MLRKNMVVERPEGTKIYRQRDCQYVYHVTGKEYRRDKKYVVESRACIGRMIDDVHMNPNDNYYMYYEMAGDGDASMPGHSDAVQVGAALLLNKIMDELKISGLLESIHGTEKANLIKDIICYMIIRETSAMQHFGDYSWGHFIKSAKAWDDSKISGFYKNDINYAQIETFLMKWNEIQPEHSGIYISYDSTNMNTKAEGIELAEFGHAKDNPEVEQVNISYAVNHENATPLFYEMYPGSIIDNSQCTHMVDRARECGYKNIGLILDRGYFSIKNIRYFDSKSYDFLMMVKTNSLLVSEKIRENAMPLVTTKAKYFLPGHDVYAVTKTGTIGDDLRVRYFHIYYDNVRAGQEKNEYLKQLERKENHVKKRVEEKTRRKEDMAAYEKHFKLKYDSNGYLQSYKRNEKKIQEEIDRLGFFVIITSREMTAGEALEIYRKRDSVEKIFRMLKTGLEYDTFRVHSQSSLESKTYVMFLASIVRNHLYQGLREIAAKEKNRKNYTVPAAISELEKVTVVKNGRDKYVRRYGLTAKQKKILGQFNMSDKDVNSTLNMLNG